MQVREKQKCVMSGRGNKGHCDTAGYTWDGTVLPTCLLLHVI
jgi:hypothetical protein